MLDDSLCKREIERNQPQSVPGRSEIHDWERGLLCLDVVVVFQIFTADAIGVFCVGGAISMRLMKRRMHAE